MGMTVTGLTEFQTSIAQLAAIPEEEILAVMADAFGRLLDRLSGAA